jgi:hypothetical protein
MAKLRNFDWRQEAQYLMNIQDKKTWQKQKASSFSDWLKTRADQEGIKISLLWRYLRVGRFAVEMQTGDWAQVKSPREIPEGINADSIELLEKINRVATTEDFNALASDLYHKKIKRPQLLKTWQIYREALPSGQTARGRGVKRPVLEDTDKNKQRLAFEQKVLRWLGTAEPVALGYESGVTLQVVHHLSERKKRQGYEAILLAFNPEEVVDVALVVFDGEGEAIPQALTAFRTERVWLMTRADTKAQDAVPRPLARFPENWGVMAVEAEGLRTLKKIPPNPTPLPLPVSELLLDFI